MSRKRTDAVESAARLTAYREYADALPLDSTEISAWLLSLSGLDDWQGKCDQLAICADLMKHAAEDDMIAADREVICAVMLRLRQEIDETSVDLRVRRHTVYCALVRQLGLSGTDVDEDPV